MASFSVAYPTCYVTQLCIPNRRYFMLSIQATCQVQIEAYPWDILKLIRKGFRSAKVRKLLRWLGWVHVTNVWIHYFSLCNVMCIADHVLLESLHIVIIILSLNIMQFPTWHVGKAYHHNIIILITVYMTRLWSILVYGTLHYFILVYYFDNYWLEVVL